MNRFQHHGDLGDIISCLPAVRQLGGGEFILAPYPHRGGGPREPMTSKRAAFLLPLLKAQPYIVDARFEERPEGITHDFSDLRLRTQKDDANHSLADWHANHLGITEPLDTSPWLQCRPDSNYIGKVIFARSERYNNTEFPWGKLFGRYAGNAVFIGFANEVHKILTTAIRHKARLALPQISNALEMAGIIAAGRLAVMNQSFPLWVALGLGKECIVSCWRPSPDVRLPRPNVTYVFDRKTSPEFYRSL